MGRLAPEITTVSKPNKNPAMAAIVEQKNVYCLEVIGVVV
jgi:hypothetical protein